MAAKTVQQHLVEMKKDITRTTERIRSLEKKVADKDDIIARQTAAIEALGNGAQFVESAVFYVALPVIADHMNRHAEAVSAGDEKKAADEQAQLEVLLELSGKLDPERFRRVFKADPSTGDPLSDSEIAEIEAQEVAEREERIARAQQDGPGE